MDEFFYIEFDFIQTEAAVSIPQGGHLSENQSIIDDSRVSWKIRTVQMSGRPQWIKPDAYARPLE